jgi:catechol 2,3-dioxygenase-like lactoylglutathione lyase family enzyme
MAVAASLLSCLALAAQQHTPTPDVKNSKLELGAFSVSLAVKDIAASRAFYEKLGFAVVMGKQEQKWLILRSGATTIGLFQGLFDKNGLTFNPGWNAEAKPLESFEDVRDIQIRLKDAGLALTNEADENSTGPASFSLLDPDGNPVLFDQHVPKPASARR